jgi:hypothetical protein
MTQAACLNMKESLFPGQESYPFSLFDMFFCTGLPASRQYTPITAKRKPRPIAQIPLPTACRLASAIFARPVSGPKLIPKACE